MTDVGPLIEALKGKLQVALTYTKEKTQETVMHTGGIYELGVNKAGNAVLWMWDTTSNDHIRQFLINNIQSFQVLDTPFFPPHPWPFKVNGEIVG